MKKIVKIFVMALVIGFCGTLTSSAPVGVPSLQGNETCLVEDDGIYCVVKDEEGNVTAKCWFCNCKHLFENQ